MKNVIVLGSNHSGSGAVVDYLSGRSDVALLFDGKEFRLNVDPYGICSFHNILRGSFDENMAVEAFDQLEQMLMDYGGKGRGKRIKGLTYSSNVPGYYSLVEEYLKSIEDVRYLYKAKYRSLKLPFWSYLLKALLRKNQFIARLPVSDDVFLKNTEAFFSRLISAYAKKKKPEVMVINQGGSIWSPERSTEYFGEDRKVICLLRDPRDQYVDLSRSKGIGDVRRFGEWMKSISSFFHLEEFHSSNVMLLSFEDFVVNHNESVSRLCDFIGIDSTVRSSYDPEISSENVGKYKKYLSPEQVESMENSMLCHANFGRR